MSEWRYVAKLWLRYPVTVTMFLTCCTVIATSPFLSYSA